MNPVDIYSLNGLPAPYWFIQLFKVLGFILHSGWRGCRSRSFFC